MTRSGKTSVLTLSTFLLLLFSFSIYPQEYRVQGKTRTVRRPSWRQKPSHRRELKEGVLLSPSTASAMGVSRLDSSRRRAKIEEAAYGKVSPKEYSAKERAVMASLERIHSSQRTMLQLLLAGQAPAKAEKLLGLIRRENKNILPALHRIKDFPCRFILDNPREIVRQNKRLNPGIKKSDLEHLLAIQIRQKHLLKTHIENAIRARRSFR